MSTLLYNGPPFNIDEMVGLLRTGPWQALIDNFVAGTADVATLEPLRSSDDYRVRVVLAHMLCQYGFDTRHDQTCQVLLELTGDDSKWVRMAAIWALGFSSGPPGEVLGRLLEIGLNRSEDRDVYFCAEEALRNLKVIS